LETPDLSFTSHDCAERLEEVISPYVAAVYYFQHRRWADSDRAVLPVLRNGARDRKWGHNLRGQLLLKKGDEKGALAEYEAAIALDSRFSLPWANKGNIFLRKEDYKEAERLYRVAIRLQESAVAFKNLADALMRQGKLDEAERLFLRSIEIDRTMWEAYFGLGEVHIRRDDLDGAEVWLQHARQLALIKTDPLVREAAVFMDLEKYEAASARFVRATRLDEHNKAAWSGLAASLALLKRYDEAYEAALKGLPDLFDAAQAAKNPSAALMAWSVSKVILDPYEIDEESTFIKLFLLIESSRKGGAPASSDKAGGSTNQELTRQQ
jgi:tetratricopeptide (TPR) repeat protein